MSASAEYRGGYITDMEYRYMMLAEISEEDDEDEEEVMLDDELDEF